MGGQILLLRNSWFEKVLVQGDQELNIGLLRDMPNFQSQYKCDLLAHSSQWLQTKAKSECDCDTHEKTWWHKVETLHGLHTSGHATLNANNQAASSQDG